MKVFGELQGEKEPPSSRHWKVAGSLAEKANAADVAVVVVAGADSSVVSGAVASIAQARETAPAFPAPSVARTVKAWPPSRRPAYDAGELHGSKPRSSRLHWNVDGSSAEKEKLALVLLLRPPGAEVTATAGARVSIVQA
ncbi:MAG: hypothetical protein H0V45_07395 [Actinobacteria bacterium]|nr:hypothetical protein [Actinomycetota bacterium]